MRGRATYTWIHTAYGQSIHTIEVVIVQQVSAGTVANKLWCVRVQKCYVLISARDVAAIGEVVEIKIRLTNHVAVVIQAYLLIRHQNAFGPVVVGRCQIVSAIDRLRSRLLLSRDVGITAQVGHRTRVIDALMVKLCEYQRSLVAIVSVVHHPPEAVAQSLHDVLARLWRIEVGRDGCLVVLTIERAGHNRRHPLR